MGTLSNSRVFWELLRTALQLLASLDAKSLRHWTDLGMEGGRRALHTLIHKALCQPLVGGLEHFFPMYCIDLYWV